MKNYRFILLRATIAVFMLLPIDASAITGYFDDPSGGQYWCNVLVSSVSSGKSYSWCTGDDEDTAMDLFRGFETEHAGTVSTENPSLKVSYRYHRTQSKDYNYDGSDHEIYVMLHGGRLHKIAEWKKDVRSAEELMRVDVYSAGGQLLQSHTPADTRATINLCHLTEGIYFVSACTHNGTRTIKKIIKR